MAKRMKPTHNSEPAITSEPCDCTMYDGDIVHCHLHNAAPDLLAVLRLMVPWMLDMHEERKKNAIINRDGYRGSFLMLAEKAQAAIRKAEGRK